MHEYRLGLGSLMGEGLMPGDQHTDGGVAAPKRLSDSNERYPVHTLRGLPAIFIHAGDRNVECER